MTRHLKHRHIRRITEYYYHRITATVDGSLPDQDSDQLETPKSIFLFFVFQVKLCLMFSRKHWVFIEVCSFFNFVSQAKCVETGESVAIKVVLQEKHVCMLDHPNVVHLFLCLLVSRMRFTLTLFWSMVYRVSKHYSRVNHHICTIVNIPGKHLGDQLNFFS